jgi:Transcriptional regulators
MLDNDHVCAYMKGCLRVRDKPSVYEVARLAGVSTATVSRVLAGYERVLPRTRDKVLTAVTELGYVPSGAAGTWPRGAPACSGCASPTLDTEDGDAPTGTTR